MKVIRTRNVDLIRSVICRPGVWQENDHSPDPTTWVPDVNNTVWLALLAGEANSLYGLVVAAQRSNSMVDVRVAFVPELWGSKLNAALGQEAAKYLFKAGAHKLVGLVPEDRPHALRYAQRVGFKREGICRSSLRRDGVWIDQTYVGLVHGE